VIKVGAATEVEMKEKKARVEDALHATRAAVEEGIVPGGGVALVRVLNTVRGLTGLNHDQDVGIAIALRAMEEPLRQIVMNAGAPLRRGFSCFWRHANSLVSRPLGGSIRTIRVFVACQATLQRGEPWKR